MFQLKKSTTYENHYPTHKKQKKLQIIFPIYIISISFCIFSSATITYDLYDNDQLRD